MNPLPKYREISLDEVIKKSRNVRRESTYLILNKLVNQEMTEADGRVT